ncbi:hypothetical protein CYLTODRAFT_327231, partial [Cylindrobasidium torrendii FP15055 ss-10]
MSAARFKLVFFCPTKSMPAVLNHLLDTFPESLGNIGEYDRVTFISRGICQFRPSPNAKPAIGTAGVLEQVEEDRVELLVNSGGAAEVKKVVEELRKVHPYEEPVYDVYELAD